MNGKNLRLAAVSSLLWSAFFCVGMGMKMAPAQDRVSAPSSDSHACCPEAGDSRREDRGGADCCSFVPGAAVAKAALPQDGSFVRTLVPRVFLADSHAARPVPASRAPPIYASPDLSPPSLRAPPAV